VLPAIFRSFGRHFNTFVAGGRGENARLIGRAFAAVPLAVIGSD
jgi:hypothetical protein